MTDPWVVTNRDVAGEPTEWSLMVGDRCVATVWKNSDCMATWHTWDRNGCGGENDVEECEPRQLVRVDICRRAMAEAMLSAVRQGFARLKKGEC